MRISKGDLKEIADFGDEVKLKQSALEDAILAFNTAVETEWEKVHECIDAYNGSLEPLRDMLDTVHSDMDGEFSDMSEKWQESDAGQHARSWIDDIELKRDQCDEISIDQPEDIEVPDLPDFDDITSVANTPSEF